MSLVKHGRGSADTAYGSAETLNWIVNEKKDRAAYTGNRQIEA
jgi:hypothetical protein